VSSDVCDETDVVIYSTDNDWIEIFDLVEFGL